ncbi:hypothetical protein ATZ36_08460 [Candidatus Endomicrobiellum trichonymphae]|jgi:subfamily B ATP-binding cassette protein MsbA|uniref:ABC transmembrane type-1 domain-containing protein n=1 Tax=Endomicrobium trichonymphae TaxID=1408204 RepID=A0A1E5IHY8_ENDTX|nr:hypothetical protein ATZ36_08460 [Candidatus Endomicrobium trichonymphae]
MYFDAVRESILKGVTTLCKGSCSVLFLVVLMLWKCFDIVIVFPIVFYPIVYFEKNEKIFSSQQIHSGSLYVIPTQSFHGIKIVKSYNTEEVESQKAKDSADMLSDIQIKMAKNNNILNPLVEFL